MDDALAGMAGRTGPDRVLLYGSIYFFGLFSGIVAYMLSDEMKDPKEAERLRFNSLQAILLGIVILALAFIPIIKVLAVLVWLYGVYMGYSAGRGRRSDIPYIRYFADLYK